MKQSATPLVGIIIPAYNAESTVQGIVDDVLRQAYDNIELIVVDDGSTDNTGKILKSLAKNDSRLRVETQVNQGPSAARNRGIELSNAAYLMFFDADDRCDTDMVRSMVERALEAQADTVVVGYIVNGTRQVIPRKFLNETGNDCIRMAVVRSMATDRLMYALWNKLFTAQIIKENGIRFDPQSAYGEDAVFNMNYLSFAQSTATVAKPLYLYSLHLSGLTRKTAGTAHSRANMIRALREFTKDQNPATKLFAVLVRLRWLLSSAKDRLSKLRRARGAA